MGSFKVSIMRAGNELDVEVVNFVRFQGRQVGHLEGRMEEGQVSCNQNVRLEMARLRKDKLKISQRSEHYQGLVGGGDKLRAKR